MAHGVPFSAVAATICASVTGAALTVAATSHHPGHPTVAAAVALVGMVATIFALGRSFRREAAEPEAAIPVVDQRARALAVLAAGLAHELGQPLSAARVSLEGIHYLKQIGRELDAHYLDRTLQRIGLNLIAMTQTIEHLKGLSNSEPSPQDVVNIVGVVSAVLAERSSWLRYQNTQIEAIYATAEIHVRADPAGVRMIISNLVRNAVEAMQQVPDESRKVVVAVGPGPEVRVIDVGPGIPADMLMKIFDPFQSSKLGGWRGIGLSLAQSSAQRMQAALVVDSEVGVGTTFTLRMEPA